MPPVLAPPGRDAEPELEEPLLGPEEQAQAARSQVAVWARAAVTSIDQTTCGPNSPE